MKFMKKYNNVNDLRLLQILQLKLLVDIKKITTKLNIDYLIENYTLTKREICLNGFTKTFKRVISREDYKPFLEIILPETNVLSIENIFNLVSLPILEGNL